MKACIPPAWTSAAQRSCFSKIAVNGASTPQADKPLIAAPCMAASTSGSTPSSLQQRRSKWSDKAKRRSCSKCQPNPKDDSEGRLSPCNQTAPWYMSLEWQSAPQTSDHGHCDTVQKVQIRQRILYDFPTRTQILQIISTNTLSCAQISATQMAVRMLLVGPEHSTGAARKHKKDSGCGMRMCDNSMTHKHFSG